MTKTNITTYIDEQNEITSLKKILVAISETWSYRKMWKAWAPWSGDKEKQKMKSGGTLHKWNVKLWQKMQKVQERESDDKEQWTKKMEDHC